MKKLISLALAAITLSSALASCAPAHHRLDSAISLASSEASVRAKWLDERLETFPTDVIVGVGSNEAYGIDMTDFEEDGYIVRTIGNDTLIFGATDNGLDRAVRVYAKAAEAGTAERLDETYHEGATIKRLVLAGRDISAYTVYTENDSVLISAAERFSSYVSEATRVTLPVSTNEPKAPYIVLRYVTDESLSTVGYRWSVTEDGLTLEFSDGYKASSPAVGVARFLEKKLDWFGLSYGYPVLSEAEYVSIDVGDKGTERCAFDAINFYGDFFHADTFTNTFPSYSPIPNSCHGFGSNQIATELSSSGWVYDQPCFLDDKFYDYAYEDLYDLIVANLDAGKEIGKDFFFVDISQHDNDNFCVCKSCKKMYRDEGNTHSASVLTWANRVTEELDELFPGLVYGVFAYGATRVPPKSLSPNEHIFMTYCFDVNCALHQLDGEKCPEGMTIIHHDSERPTNKVMTDELRKWFEKTDKIYVWYYGIGDGLLSPNYTHTIRPNIELLAELGVKGVFYENEDAGFSSKVGKLLSYHLSWNIGMTDEEYDLLVDRVMESIYGEAAPLVKEYFEMESEIYANSDCAQCFVWGYGISTTVNAYQRKIRYDEMFDLMEDALLLADDTKQERRLVNLSCVCIYLGSLGSYFDAYNAYDDERVEELCRRYALINERLSAFGVDMAERNQIMEMSIMSDEADGTYEYDLELQAWTRNWIREADWIRVYPEREMPEHIKKYIEENKNKG